MKPVRFGLRLGELYPIWLCSFSSFGTSTAKKLRSAAIDGFFGLRGLCCPRDWQRCADSGQGEKILTQRHKGTKLR